MSAATAALRSVGLVGFSGFASTTLYKVSYKARAFDSSRVVAKTNPLNTLNPLNRGVEALLRAGWAANYADRSDGGVS